MQKSMHELQKEIDHSSMIIYGIVSFMVILLAVGLFSTFKHKQERDLFLKTNQCVLKSKAEKGERIYCGKACYRPQIKETYMCSFGEHIIID